MYVVTQIILLNTDQQTTFTYNNGRAENQSSLTQNEYHKKELKSGPSEKHEMFLKILLVLKHKISQFKGGESNGLVACGLDHSGSQPFTPS